MNIYFTASIVGKNQYLPNYLKIINILQSQGHKVTSDHIIKSSAIQIDAETHEELEEFHKKLKKWIMEADCVVVETSFPSISIGFEISLALNLGKPVLLLFTKEAPSLLSSYENEKLVCEKYTSANLSEIISDFLNYAKGESDHRFTFFISSKIADHLEKISKKTHIPKSVYIRQLIEEDIDL